MKFKTSDLIAQIDVLIAQCEADAAAATEKWKQDQVTARAKWLAEHGEHYVRFANRVKDKIRKGHPITLDDIPSEIRSYSDRLRTFSGSDTREPRPAATSRLSALRATLAAVTDTEVSTTGLREIGFKDISALFSAVSR